MPLNKGAAPGSKEFGENIATEEKAGKPAKQAEAIAFSVSKRDGGVEIMADMDEGKFEKLKSLLNEFFSEEEKEPEHKADARLDAALDKVALLDRVARRSELRGHPDSYSELAKGPIADLTEARQTALSLIQGGKLSRSDAQGTADSREQIEERVAALKTKIKSAREAAQERSIEEMENEVADLEAKLAGENEDEADGKPDGAKLDAILNKVSHMTKGMK